MKSLVRLILILATLSALSPHRLQAAVVDKIKAVVNNEVITQSEIDRLLYPLYLRYKDIYKGLELDEKLSEVTDEILEQLITDRLMLSEAKKEGIVISREEIDQKVKELEARFASEGGLTKMLREQNLAIADLETRFTDQLMIEKVIDRKVRHRIQILPQEAENYYREHIDKFKEPEQARVGSILIRFKEGERTPEETLALSVNILQRLQAGEDFKAMARNYSEGMNPDEGGDMGYTRKGQMVDDIDKAIFSLEIGGISDLIESSLGYHIFKVYDRKKARTVPAIEARPHIMDAIYRQKVETKFKEWVKELKENAFISIK